MLWWIVLVVLLVPVIEIWGLILIGNWLGPLLTIALVLLAGLLGVYLGRRGGFEAYRLAQIQMRNGEMPGEAILDGFAVLIGAILLITPGFFTDLLGLFFFIPLTRAWIKMGIKHWLQKKFTSGNFRFFWFDPRRR